MTAYLSLQLSGIWGLFYDLVQHCVHRVISICKSSWSGQLGGVPGGIRTLDPLLRSYTMGLDSTNFEAKLLFSAYRYFSFKTPISNPCL